MQSAASPYFYFLPSDFLNFGDLMTMCEVMESNQETIFSLPQKTKTKTKKQYFPRITDFILFYFFTDSWFLDSASVSGKGSGDF